MKMTRQLWALSALSILSFALTACDDDDSSGGSNSASCVAADVKCEGNVLYQCNVASGELESTDCAAEGMVCNETKKMCEVAASASCTSADNRCDENDNLIECKDGELTTTSCTSQNQICNANTLKCETPEAGDECTETACSEEGEVLLECINGNLKRVDCEAQGKVCQNSQCVVEHECEFGQSVCDPSGTNGYKTCGNDYKFGDVIACEEGSTCEYGTCNKAAAVKELVDGEIGSKCSCEGDNCKITISGKELKAAISSTIIGMAPIVGITLPADDDVIEAPNYFSDGIVGCDKVVAPAGMAVGCFYDAQVTFPESVINLLGSVEKIAGLIPGLNLGDLDLSTLVTEMKALLQEGISFAAPEGYCLAANIDIALSVESSSITQFINKDQVQVLVEKINTPGHDHAQAKQAVCPDGSVKLWYDVSSAKEGTGSADVGFDLCMRACEADTDCRDGYECVEMTYGSAENIKAGDLKAKVCFDQANIDYFKGITDKFAGMI